MAKRKKQRTKSPAKVIRPIPIDVEFSPLEVGRNWPSSVVKPSVPLDPVYPTSPTSPTQPTSPTGPPPTRPLDPVYPTSPTSPTEPVAPTAPTAPTAPVAPTAPTAPTGPVEPTSPTSPTSPTAPDPTAPVSPTDELTWRFLIAVDPTVQFGGARLKQMEKQIRHLVLTELASVDFLGDVTVRVFDRGGVRGIEIFARR